MENNTVNNILIIDDDASMRLTLSESLYGETVIEASSGDEGIEKFEQSNADLILLDVTMPGKDGYQTCLEIRKKARGKKVPIVMVTGNDDVEAIEQAYKAGATDFITKPINMDLLPHRVKYILQASKAIDDFQREHEIRTELTKELEDAHNQLLQSEKLAALGELAAGVAHEINNPVGFISSNITSLQGYVEDLLGLIGDIESSEVIAKIPDIKQQVEEICKKYELTYIKEDVTDLLEESKDGVTRVKKIVNDLKNFARTDEAEWEQTNLHDCIDSTLNVANNEIKYKAKVVKQYGDIPEIECIASQVNQVILNMVVNASHAIEKEGTITISTGQENDEVWFEVADTGKGIAKEHLQKIFNPFFTTKPVGKGTGLGLSLSYGIINKHGGRIDVESEVGVGTRFKIFLPIEAKKQTAEGGA